jgi:hypothetical protein
LNHNHLNYQLNNQNCAIALGVGLAGLLLWGWVLGCARPGQAPAETKTAGVSGVTVVLPFVDMAKVFGQNVSVRNPVTSKVFLTGIIDEKATPYMTNTLYRLIGRQGHLRWRPHQNATDSNKLGALGLNADHVLRLQELARQEDADAVMVGYLYAFRDRSGGDYAVETPARVAFELVMMQSSTGRVIWQRSFKETQKSLAEDLMQIKQFLKRKGRWVSAKEMAKSALEEMLQSVPHLGTQ